MKIEDLKASIENKTVDHSSKIFVGSDPFLTMQYAREISQCLKLPLEKVDSLDNISRECFDIFQAPIQTLRLVFQDEVKDLPATFFDLKDVLVIAKKCELKDACVVKFPKLEKWMLTDYAYSLADGVDKKKLDHLVDLCNGDIYRLDSELKKLTIFQPDSRNDLFSLFENEGMFSDLSNDTIFTLSNAIMTRDVETVRRIYSNINNIDVEPMGLLVVLYNNVKNVIQVQLNPSATAESCGLSDKQFYAVKKFNCGYYTKDELLKMFDVISDLDRKIKTGEFPVNELIDYLIVNTLGVSV